MTEFFAAWLFGAVIAHIIYDEKADAALIWPYTLALRVKRREDGSNDGVD